MVLAGCDPFWPIRQGSCNFDQLFHVPGPTELGCALFACDKKMVRELRTAGDRSHSVGQPTKIERTEVNGGRATNLPVHLETGSGDGYAAGHGFQQRMGERFRIGGTDVNVAGTVKMMKRLVRQRPQLNDVFLDAKFTDQLTGSPRAVTAQLCLGLQFAGKEQLDGALGNPLCNEG
jgi:hypothetical protein